MIQWDLRRLVPAGIVVKSVPVCGVALMPGEVSRQESLWEGLRLARYVRQPEGDTLILA